MCRKQAKKMDWLTDRKTKGDCWKALQERKNEHQQNQLVQLIKQETHSVKQMNIIDRVNRWCWFMSLTVAGELWWRGGWVEGGGGIAPGYNASDKSMSEPLCLMSEPRPAPHCPSVWLMRLSAAAIASLHHPSLLDGPLISGQRERRATIDTCLQGGVITEFSHGKFL